MYYILKSCAFEKKNSVTFNEKLTACEYRPFICEILHERGKADTFSYYIYDLEETIIDISNDIRSKELSRAIYRSNGIYKITFEKLSFVFQNKSFKTIF